MAIDWTQAFASSDTTKIPLESGSAYYIVVRNQLGYAEQRGIETASIKGISRAPMTDPENSKKDQLVELDMLAGAQRKVLTWLVDWNLPGKDGKTVDITASEQAKADAVKALHPEAYKALEKLIDAHVADQDAKKNTATTERSSAVM